MSSQRAQRVGDLIQQEISRLLLKEVRDPRIAFVTITGVEPTNDLQLARVYYTVMSDDAAARDACGDGLRSAVPFLRRELGRVLRLRRVPELEFRYDNSIAYGCRIEELLKEIHRHEPTE